jgi:hypothetical protein
MAVDFIVSIFFLMAAAVVLFLLFFWVASRVSEGTLSNVGWKYIRTNDTAGRMRIRDYAETDLRLTYKRFKELYPFSPITYQEYKQLQARKAFRRAVSSEKIKRMVR